jgi:predicted Zn-dependent protease
MNYNFTVLILLLLSFSSCSQTTKVKIPEKIVYDFSCMETDDISSFINMGSDLEKDLLGTFGDPVTIEEEVECGDSTLVQMKKEGNVSQVGAHYQRVKVVLNKLTPKIKDARGFNYSVYLLESEELNAFTIGGKIFFTTAMIDFCESDDEIACIIGHEIAHNELGHINDGISRLKTAGRFGEVGQMSSAVASLATTSFNQKNEAHSDFIGIDLAYAAGYNGCAGAELWKRMKKQEDGHTGIDTFFSSHPFSEKREACTKQHIKSNYLVNCGN